jgi:hypothetical protein
MISNDSVQAEIHIMTPDAQWTWSEFCDVTELNHITANYPCVDSFEFNTRNDREESRTRGNLNI